MNITIQFDMLTEMFSFRDNERENLISLHLETV